MAEALKDSFGPEVPRRIAAMIRAVYPGFPSRRFVADALEGYEEPDLTPRAWHVARALRRHLPHDYDEAIAVLLASLGPPIEEAELSGMEVFVYLPYVFFVAEYGLDHFDTSMRAQHELTQRFTAEFSIRAFLDRDTKRTLGVLRTWARDPSPHVRRLVSEGTRPRLPWAPRLRRFQDDPRPVLDLLELLRDDPEPSVRRSVANNLNDIGKDHPGLLVETCRRWARGASPERLGLIRHALRSAVKRGDAGALELLGFGTEHQARVRRLSVEPARASIGQTIRVSFDLENAGSEPRAFNADLRVHFVKANGATSPKVFKVRAVTLATGSAVRLTKSISLRQHSTRTHYPGRHRVEIVVNGRSVARGSFEVA
jgi:3-methyladenine DNA glycosylase AlkC